MQTLENYLSAGYPLIAVSALDDQAVTDFAPERLERLSYSGSGVLIDDSTGAPAAVQPAGFPAAFQAAADRPGCLLVVRDCQHLLKNPPIYRALLDCAENLKRNGSAIVLVAPNWAGGLIPAELQHSIALLDLPMPNREQLAGRLRLIVSAAGIPEPSAELAAALLDGAAGLTADQCENALALSLVECGSLSPAIIQREKAALIRGSGFLSVEQPAPIDRIGGLGELKRYFSQQVLPNFKIPDLAVRGVLLCGLPGTGKTLAAKAAAAVLGIPLIRLDIAACKGSLVGQSEANIRSATKLIESISPAVLWIDEIEKAVAGFRSSAQSDGGTTLGMIGHLLTWLQEHDRPIFTIATCNDYQALPDELARSGRIDARFFVDLPTVTEREAIAAVHLARFGCPVELARTIAQRTADFSGAEIESLIKTAARLSGRAIKLADLELASKTEIPIAAVKPDFVREFRNWGKKSMRLANDPLPPAELANRRAALAERN